MEQLRILFIRARGHRQSPVLRQFGRLVLLLYLLQGPDKTHRQRHGQVGDDPGPSLSNATLL